MKDAKRFNQIYARNNYRALRNRHGRGLIRNMLCRQDRA